MATDNLSKEQREEYSLLCQNGIGWNIKYAPGTFEIVDGKRVLKQPKMKKLYDDIMCRYVNYITVEGGKRGGKDVNALYGYANYLMMCPDKLHLVTGQSQAHAIQTVYEADGFGLKYLLPHGELYTEENRRIFRFIDFYGIPKKVFFYGGANANDYTAFEGITFGSHYANEAINQHPNTIEKAATRTFASKFRKIIHTQNPKAGLYAYYTDYEEPKKVKMDEVDEIFKKQELYKQALPKNEQVVKNMKDKAYKEILNKYLNGLNIKSINELKLNQDAYKSFVVAIRDAFLTIDRKSEEFLRYDYINFEPYYPNPNGVRNGLNFRYYHFDFYDNLAMTDLERHKVEDSYDKNSLVFKRDVRGIRASANNAIYDTFTSKNILHDEKPYYFEGRRFIAVDYGMKNDFVAIDCQVDTLNVVKVWTEIRVHPTQVINKGELPTDTYYVNKIIDLINSKNDGKYISIIVDPSAKSLINELRNKHLRVMKARNDVGLKERPDKKVEGTMVGVRLVRQAFDKQKLFIHESCVEGIAELQGYSLDDNHLARGEEVILKINDHFPDAVRYIENTIVRSERKLNIGGSING